MAKTNAELLTLIQEKLEDVIENPRVDYQVGQKRFSHSHYVDHLLAIKARLEEGSVDASEEIETFAFGTGEFGENTTEES